MLISRMVSVISRLRKDLITFMIYIYRCSDCKRLDPKYESAASILGAKKKFVLAKVGVN